mmetsp:Transcript_69923/g.167841  ORF Transcript_69923/g.167841 Transcript_69923/m.167841 type:complete len:201 (-) Transcript_69923:1310-1912(-)
MSVTSSTAFTSSSAISMTGSSGASVGGSSPASFAASCFCFRRAAFLLCSKFFFLTGSFQSFCTTFHTLSASWSACNFSLKSLPGTISSTRVVRFRVVIHSFSFASHAAAGCQLYCTASKPSSAEGKLKVVKALFSTDAPTSTEALFLHHSCFSSSVKVTSSSGTVTSITSSGLSQSSVGFPSFSRLEISIDLLRISCLRF